MPQKHGILGTSASESGQQLFLIITIKYRVYRCIFCFFSIKNPNCSNIFCENFQIISDSIGTTVMNPNFSRKYNLAYSNFEWMDISQLCLSNAHHPFKIELNLFWQCNFNLFPFKTYYSIHNVFSAFEPKKSIDHINWRSMMSFQSSTHAHHWNWPYFDEEKEREKEEKQQ